MLFETAKRAVVQVGGGRGFVVSAGETRYVITAAHCLPHYPEPHLANGASELSYENILGALGQQEQTVWAELVEFNAASDVAVLGEPDGQVLWDESYQYQAFTGQAMTIGKSPAPLAPYLWEERSGTAAFILSLDFEWQPCTSHNGGRFLMIGDGADGIKSGMSGSPIIDINGAAIGLVSTSGPGENKNPSLMDCLPHWLQRELDTSERAIEQEAEA
jgi:S1-C subfamily serine protease